MPVLLTDLLLRRKRPPARGRLQLWDAKATGLVFRLTPNGARTWSVYYRAKGAQRRLTLGPYRPEDSAEDGLTLGEARAKAREVLRAAADDRDPQAEKMQSRREALRSGVTLAVVAEKWLAAGRTMKGARRGQPWRPKTREEFERLVRDEITPVLGDMKPEAVTKREIRALYDRIEARSASVAKHTLAVLRLLYTWAAEEDHVDAVPLFPKRGTQSNKRTRVLEEAEIRAVVKTLDAGLGEHARPDRVEPMAEAFRLILLTAQRRGEVLSMRWNDVTEEKDGAWWTIPADRHKGGRDHRVPLTAAAVDALKRLHSIVSSDTWVFPTPKGNITTGRKARGTSPPHAPHVANPQKAASRLWAKSQVTGATLHDLRRTAATYMVRLGTPRLVVGKVLGHADTDVTGRYDKHAYDREKRAALRRWGDELQRVAAAKPRKTEKRVLPWVG
jgi:integrase